METEPIELFEETSPDRKNSPISSTNSKEQRPFEFTPIDTEHGLSDDGGSHTVKDEEGNQPPPSSRGDKPDMYMAPADDAIKMKTDLGTETHAEQGSALQWPMPDTCL